MSNTTIYTGDTPLDGREIDNIINMERSKVRLMREIEQVPEVDRSPPIAHDEMFPGVLGELVTLCCQQSEAVPAAVGAYAIALFSALVGPTVYYQLGDERRWLNNYYLLVGPSGMGKGASEYGPRRIFRRVENLLAERFAQHWKQGMTEGLTEYPSLDIHDGGLSSGEGLATAKADDLKMGKDEPPVQVTDKRFLLLEPEFGNVLNMAQRKGNTLSHVLRNGYDGKTIRPLTKRDRVCVTDPFFVMVGSITPGELTGHDQNAVMTVNGMLNRTLMLWTRTNRMQPIPVPIPEVPLNQLADVLAERVLFARDNRFETHFRKQAEAARPVRMSPEAEQFWIEHYSMMMNGADCALVKTLCQRHRLHVLILSSLFALLDGQWMISADHIACARHWANFARRSVIYSYRHFEGQQSAKHHRTTAMVVLNAIDDLINKNGECKTSDLYHWFSNHITRELLTNAIGDCINFIPPLITQSKTPGQRGRPTIYFQLTAEGRHKLSAS